MDNEEIKNDMKLHLPILAAITVAVVIAQFVNRYIIYVKSSEMINDVRINMYSAIIHQPLSYFSEKEHSAGELTAILSEDMRMLNVSSVDTYIILLQGIAGMIAGGLICLCYNWKMGLVACLLIPLFFFMIILQAKEKRSEKKDSAGYSKYGRTILSD